MRICGRSRNNWNQPVHPTTQEKNPLGEAKRRQEAIESLKQAGKKTTNNRSHNRLIVSDKTIPVCHWQSAAFRRVGIKQCVGAKDTSPFVLVRTGMVPGHLVKAVDIKVGVFVQRPNRTARTRRVAVQPAPLPEAA